MKLLLFYKIICMLSLKEDKQFPTELDFVKPFFFNAPIGNFDSSTLNFFKTNLSFHYETKKGDWSAVDNDTKTDCYYQDFYFGEHPIFKHSFDTGKISFYYPERNGVQNLFSITLEISFANEQECSSAYNTIIDKFKNLSFRKFFKNGETITWNKEDFNHFKHIYFSYRKETTFDSRIFYELDLKGK